MLSRFKYTVEHWIRRLRVRRCPIPFVILFRGRSGSTHLCSLLGGHPEVLCRHEIFAIEDAKSRPVIQPGIEIVEYNQRLVFRRLTGFHQTTTAPSSKAIRQHLHDLYSTPFKACGFKLKFPIQMDLFPEVVAELKRFLPDLRIILLYRRNALKQAISLQNLQRIQSRYDDEFANANAETQLEPSVMQTPFSIDVDAVIQQARWIRSRDSQFFDSVKRFGAVDPNRILQVDYEDLLEQEDSVIQQVFEFLEVDPSHRPTSHIVKVTPNQLADALSNYAELQAAVEGTEFESCL